MDGGPPLVCTGSCVNVTVNVEDACDHIPTFGSNLPRTVNISESTPVGAPVRVSYNDAVLVLSVLIGNYCCSYRSRPGY